MRKPKDKKLNNKQEKKPCKDNLKQETYLKAIIKSINEDILK